MHSYHGEKLLPLISCHYHRTEFAATCSGRGRYHPAEGIFRYTGHAASQQLQAKAESRLFNSKPLSVAGKLTLCYFHLFGQEAGVGWREQRASSATLR